LERKKLFKFPFGYYFRRVGGEPLDRSGGLNKVDAIASIFERKVTFRLAVAPEGTRKKVSEIRSGFYYIAVKANVPIIPVAFDWSKKEVNLGQAFFPTGYYEADLQILRNHYKDVSGKILMNGFKL
jgi:1-acyl-sn-glycerol-3-phosphate acyltransferase